MAVILVLLGLLGWVVGGVLLGSAKGAIHDVGGLTCIGLGSVTIGLGLVVNRLDDIFRHMKKVAVTPKPASTQSPAPPAAPMEYREPPPRLKR